MKTSVTGERVAVPGYPGWEADTNGNVYRNGVECGTPNGGYYKVRHNGKMIKRALLVLNAFHGPRPEGCVIRHLNDVGLDDRPENLAWGTNNDNAQDKLRNGGYLNCGGRMSYGESHGRAVLSDEAVIAMRADYATGGTTIKELAEVYGVSWSQADRIVKRKQRTDI